MKFTPKTYFYSGMAETKEGTTAFCGLLDVQDDKGTVHDILNAIYDEKKKEYDTDKIVLTSFNLV